MSEAKYAMSIVELSAANRNTIVARIFTGSAEYALRMVDRGFRFVNVRSDTQLMASGSHEIISAMRDKGG